MAKLPLPPADLARVGIGADEVRTLPVDQLWWRLHRTRGPHALAWNQLRHYGPVDARFDPHEPPPRRHESTGVWYAAATPRTCIAEVFGRTRTLITDSDYHLTSGRLTEPVTVLDITGETGHGAWATRAGASMALATGRHDYTRAWARAIVAAFPDLAGIAYRAAMDGGLAIALFGPAAPALPTDALTSRALADPALSARLATVCEQIGYTLQ